MKIVKLEEHNCDVCGNPAKNQQLWDLPMPMMVEHRIIGDYYSITRKRSIEVRQIDLCDKCADKALRLETHTESYQPVNEPSPIRWRTNNQNEKE